MSNQSPTPNINDDGNDNVVHGAPPSAPQAASPQHSPPLSTPSPTLSSTPTLTTSSPSDNISGEISVSPYQEPAFHSPPTPLQSILTNLKESTISSNQEFLARIADYTTSPNLSLLTVLVPILNLFFTHSPTITTTATSFLLTLSTHDPSTRFDIAYQCSGAAISRLFDTLTNVYKDITTPEARDNAARTFYYLALEPRNKIPIGQTDGLVLALVHYWLDESISEYGRQGAGMALKELVTKCEENVDRVMGEVEKVMEGIFELATDKERGNSLLRMTALDIMAEIGRTETHCWLLVEWGVMEEMVQMLRENDLVSWSLSVMMGMSNGGLKGREFKRLAKRTEAEETLVHGKEWGEFEWFVAKELMRIITSKSGEKRRLGEREEEEEESD